MEILMPGTVSERRARPGAWELVVPAAASCSATAKMLRAASGRGFRVTRRVRALRIAGSRSDHYMGVVAGVQRSTVWSEIAGMRLTWPAGQVVSTWLWYSAGCC